MPKIVAPLIDIQVRNARSRTKGYKLAAGGGLYLEVMPTGSPGCQRAALHFVGIE
jgi:hypothetical protein